MEINYRTRIWAATLINSTFKIDFSETLFNNGFVIPPHLHIKKPTSIEMYA